MRWYVHGTDHATARPVSIVIDEDTSAAAVQVAIGKGVLVSHVTRGPRFRGVMFAIPLMAAGILTLAAACGQFYWSGAEAREQVVAAQAEEARLADALTESGAQLALLQRRTAALELAQGGAAHQLGDQLEAAQRAAAEISRELADARGTISGLEKRAGQAGQLQSQLNGEQAKVAELETQLKTRRLQLDEFAKAKSAAAELAKTNQELAGQVEVLKTQLLDQTAKSLSMPVAQIADAPIPPAKPQRWALKLSYDAAADFLALRVDKDPTSQAGSSGLVTTSGLSGSNAATLRLTHDMEKTRLYAATLGVSLSQDAPKENLAQNQRLLADFLQQFAPNFKDSAAWAADTVRALAGKDVGEKIVHVGDDYKLTVWNNRLGLYSWKIESPRGDFDE